jgi:hypothetical protein
LGRRRTGVTGLPVVMAQTSPYSTRFKVIAVVVLTVAISLFVIAFLTLSENKDQGLSADNAEVVDALIPAANTQVPQQSSVGIDLAVGWDGVLQINGVEIPEDELVVTPQTGLIMFTPGDGKTVEQFETGRNCVTAVIWRIQDGRGTADRQVPWCFEVV